MRYVWLECLSDQRHAEVPPVVVSMHRWRRPAVVPAGDGASRGGNLCILQAHPLQMQPGLQPFSAGRHKRVLASSQRWPVWKDRLGPPLCRQRRRRPHPPSAIARSIPAQCSPSHPAPLALHHGLRSGAGAPCGAGQRFGRCSRAPAAWRPIGTLPGGTGQGPAALPGAPGPRARRKSRTRTRLLLARPLPRAPRPLPWVRTRSRRPRPLQPRAQVAGGGV